MTTPSAFLPPGLPQTLGTLSIDQQAALIACFTGDNIAGTVFPDGSMFTFPLQTGPPQSPTYAAYTYDLLWQNWLNVLYPAVATCRAQYSGFIASGQEVQAKQVLSAAINTGLPLNSATMVMGWGFAATADQEWLYGYAWVAPYGQPTAAGPLPVPPNMLANVPVPPLVPAGSATPVTYSLGPYIGSEVDLSTGKTLIGLWYTTPQSDPPVGTKTVIDGMNFLSIEILTQSGFITDEGLRWQLQGVAAPAGSGGGQ